MFGIYQTLLAFGVLLSSSLGKAEDGESLAETRTRRLVNELQRRNYDVERVDQGNAAFTCTHQKMQISVATLSGLAKEDFVELGSLKECQQKANTLRELFSSYTRPVVVAICKYNTRDAVLERRLLDLGSSAQNNTRIENRGRHLGLYNIDPLQRLPDLRFTQTGECQKQANLINNAPKEMPLLGGS
jgi:hypothetical protein